MEIDKYKLLKKVGETFEIDSKTEYYMKPSKREEYILVKNSNYIHKDKIREKIKEYEGLKEMDMTAYEEQIKPLQELLEGE